MKIAILVFLVGATAVNFFVWKMQGDRLGYVDPLPPMVGNPLDPALDAYMQEREREQSIYDSNMRLHQVHLDEALAAEAVIMTIAGVSYFLSRSHKAA